MKRYYLETSNNDGEIFKPEDLQNGTFRLVVIDKLKKMSLMKQHNDKNVTFSRRRNRIRWN